MLLKDHNDRSIAVGSYMSTTKCSVTLKSGHLRPIPKGFGQDQEGSYAAGRAKLLKRGYLGRRNGFFSETPVVEFRRPIVDKSGWQKNRTASRMIGAWLPFQECLQILAADAVPPIVTRFA